MKSFAISFLGRTLTVEAPDDLAPRVAAFFALAMSPHGSQPTGRARIAETAPGRFALVIDERPAVGDLTRGDVVARLAAELTAVAAHPAGTVALKAAAVGWNDKAILIVGADGAGKSALAAWLIDKGFAYLADNSVVLSPTGAVTGFPGPLAFDPAKLSHVASLPGFRDAPSLASGGRMLIGPDRTWLVNEPSGEVGLIIEISFAEGGALRLEPLPADATVLRLLEATRKVVIPGDPEHAPLARLAEQVPALKLTYGHYSQLDGVLDFLTRMTIESESAPAELEKFLRGLPRAVVEPKVYPIPARSDRKFDRKLTIGMATYDDFDGVYFTLQAIRMYHPEVLDDVEFVVIDNHPDGPAGAPLKAFEDFIPNLRYIPMADTYGTGSAKDRVFVEARGEFVLCMDCHILVVPGALRRLLDYFERNPLTRDLLQGPVLNDGLTALFSHNNPTWAGGFYGTWAQNPAADNPDGEPFEIPMQNTGLFACRRAVWPGFNKRFRGFVTEEGYIHQKFRNAGGRALCLPFLRCLHRMRRVQGVPYPSTWEDRIRNHLIGLRELGLPSDDATTHFRELLGEGLADRLIREAMAAIEDMERSDRSPNTHPDLSST